MRRATPIELSPEERAELERWTVTSAGSGRLGTRARIVLEAAGGRTNGQIAARVGVHPETVTRWRLRFAVNRLEGLRRDAPRSGRRAAPPSNLEERILQLVSGDAPVDHPTWTTRSLARRLEVNHMLVHRTLRAHDRRTSTGPRTGSVRVDVGGVFLHSPAAAIVFEVNPTAVAPAPDDTDAPASTRVSGGYLFSDRHAAPSALVGVLSRAEELITRVADTGRSPHELLVFLRAVDETLPRAARLHVFSDRPLAYVSERVTAWLDAHPRFEVAATPAGRSWTDEVERWLHAWDGAPLQVESFANFAPLIEAVARAVGTEAAMPYAFAWTTGPTPPSVMVRGSPRERPTRTERTALPARRFDLLPRGAAQRQS